LENSGILELKDKPEKLYKDKPEKLYGMCFSFIA